jgi:hypothetical protein
MKLLRMAAAGVLWALACLLGLVGSLLCVTVILLPIGLLLISLARRLFRLSGRLMLPKAVRHPLAELGDTGREAGRSLLKDAKSAGKTARGSTKKLPGRRRRVLGIKI